MMRFLVILATLLALQFSVLKAKPAVQTVVKAAAAPVVTTVKPAATVKPVGSVGGRRNSTAKTNGSKYLCKLSDRGILASLKTGKTLPSHPKFKKFMECAFQAKQLMSKYGDLNESGIKEFLKKRTKTQNEVDAIYQRCVKRYSSSQDTAYNIGSCFHDNGVKLSTYTKIVKKTVKIF